MDQHKKRRLRRWHLHVRLDRFLTILGSLIILATFIFKDGLSERLKDSVSNVDTWVMHTKSTPRDDSARLVAGRK